MPILTSLSTSHFGALRQPLEWHGHGALNVIIGENDTGKTQLLKLLYAMTRSIDEYWRKHAGPDPQPLQALLARKLGWTFLTPSLHIGKLVSYGAARMDVLLNWSQQGSLQFVCNNQAERELPELKAYGLEQLDEKYSTFIPPKEILSILDAIHATRRELEIAAFDDTYYDLYDDFYQVIGGKNSRDIEQALKKISTIIGMGEFKVDGDTGGVLFRRGDEEFNMHQIAEGIKKVGILMRLVRNRSLSFKHGSLLFLDEPEVNLHPRAILQFAELLHGFAQSGIQVYLTTHSYFMLKRLEQLARQHNTDYQLLDLRRTETAGVIGNVSRLADGLPDNPIVEQSLKLFDLDVELDLGA